jgi:(E)-4-hydroxy-3-methylbut-2-enyl-diphosphate synthase
MRVSLTGDPINEVYFAAEILKALDLRNSIIRFVSCPTCGRCGVNLSEIALEIENALKPMEKKMKDRQLPSFTVAVMGCEVNGPGEAREAAFGVACGKGKGLIFKKGKPVKNVREEDISKELIKYIEQEKILI